MHELSIVTYVIEQVDEIAKENKLTNIQSVTLELGVRDHTGVSERLLEMVRQKTPLIEHTEFKYEIIPAVTWCDDCKTTYPTVKYGKTCPNCGSGHTWLQQGQEMNLKEIVAC